MLSLYQQLTTQLWALAVLAFKEASSFFVLPKCGAFGFSYVHVLLTRFTIKP